MFIIIITKGANSSLKTAIGIPSVEFGALSVNPTPIGSPSTSYLRRQSLPLPTPSLTPIPSSSVLHSNDIPLQSNKMKLQVSIPYNPTPHTSPSYKDNNNNPETQNSSFASGTTSEYSNLAPSHQNYYAAHRRPSCSNSSLSNISPTSASSPLSRTPFDLRSVVREIVMSEESGLYRRNEKFHSLPNQSISHLGEGDESDFDFHPVSEEDEEEETDSEEFSQYQSSWRYAPRTSDFAWRSSSFSSVSNFDGPHYSNSSYYNHPQFSTASSATNSISIPRRRHSVVTFSVPVSGGQRRGSKSSSRSFSSSSNPKSLSSSIPSGSITLKKPSPEKDYNIMHSSSPSERSMEYNSSSFTSITSESEHARRGSFSKKRSRPAPNNATQDDSQNRNLILLLLLLLLLLFLCFNEKKYYFFCNRSPSSSVGDFYSNSSPSDNCQKRKNTNMP